MVVAAPDPPEVFALLAHPVRWHVLDELGRSDRTVGELTTLLDTKQSLVSYHLSLLNEAGLVTSRSSSADRRDRYYAVDTEACEAQLDAGLRALRTGLTVSSTEPSRTRQQRVLFLCTGNSARSQIAEALANAWPGGAFKAFSAGSHPKELHPNAVRVLRKRGIDISGVRTKHLDEFANRRFDLVITLCDKVREVCPPFPDRPTAVHWSIADPALERYPAFEALADDIERRLRGLLHRLPLRSTGKR
ncbi:MAG: MarR family transcriptional regulator [Acidimicrobiia bacterium]